jgi:hypothetical protein
VQGKRPVGDEKRKPLAIDALTLEALRHAGVMERPVWREAFIRTTRTIELSTRKQEFLTLAPAELLSLTEWEIVNRLRTKLAERSTQQFL